MASLIFIIALAVAFDFINGFHDAANSIATVVSTRVLSPRWAVVWAAFFNFVAFLVFSTHVAGNIAKGVDTHVVTLALVAAGLVGAIVWDLLTWWWGLPTSSSHALLGGLAGAAIWSEAGVGSLDAPFFEKTALFIVISPVVGCLLGFTVMKLVMRGFGNTPQGVIDRTFRKLQLVSAAFYSLGHGGNDAQKTMGIIAAALVASHKLIIPVGAKGPSIPLWVVLVCHAAMGLGTLSGGWRIVRTMGMKIMQASAGRRLLRGDRRGVDARHGHVRRHPGLDDAHHHRRHRRRRNDASSFSAVRWGVAGRIVWAWVLTVPGAAAISATTWLVLHLAGVD